MRLGEAQGTIRINDGYLETKDIYQQVVEASGRHYTHYVYRDANGNWQASVHPAYVYGVTKPRIVVYDWTVPFTYELTPTLTYDLSYKREITSYPWSQRQDAIDEIVSLMYPCADRRDGETWLECVRRKGQSRVVRDAVMGARRAARIDAARSRSGRNRRRSRPSGSVVTHAHARKC